MARRANRLVMSTPAVARNFVANIKLPDLPSPRSPACGNEHVFSVSGQKSRLLRSPFAAMLQEDLADDKLKVLSTDLQSVAGAKIQASTEQAFIVGSQIVSFDREVTEDRRSAATNSCLLAQLHASAVHPSPSTADEAFEWHAAYINVLVNIGWVLQTGVTSQQSAGAQGAQVSKALLDLIQVLIPGGQAVVLAAKVFDALKNLDASDPFITLYASRVVEQDLVEFGASLGTGDGAGFLLQVVECAVQIQAKHQEVLFFKWDASNAKIDGRRYDLSLADGVYKSVADQIAAKVAPYTQSFVKDLSLVPPLGQPGQRSRE